MFVAVCQCTEFGCVKAAQVSCVGSQGNSPPFGRRGVGSTGLGMQGLWLSLTTILLEIFQSKGISTLSCGFKQSHSNLFHPVPLRLQEGLESLVSSAGM